MNVLKLSVSSLVGSLLALLCLFSSATEVTGLAPYDPLARDNIDFLIDEIDDEGKEYNHAIKVHGNADIYLEKKVLATQDNDLGDLLDELLKKNDKEKKMAILVNPSTPRIYLAIKHKKLLRILVIYQKNGKYIGSLTPVRSMIFAKKNTFYLLDPFGSKENQSSVFIEPKLALFFKKYSSRMSIKKIKDRNLLPTIK